MNPNDDYDDYSALDAPTHLSQVLQTSLNKNAMHIHMLWQKDTMMTFYEMKNLQWLPIYRKSSQAQI